MRNFAPSRVLSSTIATDVEALVATKVDAFRVDRKVAFYFNSESSATIGLPANSVVWVSATVATVTFDRVCKLEVM